MTFFSRLFLLLTLGYLFVGTQGRMVIGYRTAAEVGRPLPGPKINCVAFTNNIANLQEEAVQINERNTPFRDPAFDNLPGGSQIGNGIYLGKSKNSFH